MFSRRIAIQKSIWEIIVMLMAMKLIYYLVTSLILDALAQTATTQCSYTASTAPFEV